MLQFERKFSALSLEDRQLIEQDHARLERFLSDLRSTCHEFSSLPDCNGCDKEKVASCRGQLPSFFYDYLDLVEEHFENEEGILLGVIRTPGESAHLKLHHAEHARLLQDVRQQINEASALSRQGNVAAALLQFYQRVAAMFVEHERAFDSTFLKIVEDQ